MIGPIYGRFVVWLDERKTLSFTQLDQLIRQFAHQAFIITKEENTNFYLFGNTQLVIEYSGLATEQLEEAKAKLCAFLSNYNEAGFWVEKSIKPGASNDDWRHGPLGSNAGYKPIHLNLALANATCMLDNGAPIYHACSSNTLGGRGSIDVKFIQFGRDQWAQGVRFPMEDEYTYTVVLKKFERMPVDMAEVENIGVWLERDQTGQPNYRMNISVMDYLRRRQGHFPCELGHPYLVEDPNALERMATVKDEKTCASLSDLQVDGDGNEKYLTARLFPRGPYKLDLDKAEAMREYCFGLRGFADLTDSYNVVKQIITWDFIPAN